MTDKRLEQLLAISRLIRDRELTRLAALAAERERTRECLRTMRADRARTIAGAAPDAAHICGADEAWLRWQAGRLADQAGRAARAAADAEDQITQARRAFGRAEALYKVTRKQSGR